MTEVLDPPAGPPADGGPAHAVVQLVERLSRALADVAESPAWSMTPDEQREALIGLHRAEAGLVELRLRVLASADRNEVGADSGATSTPAWFAHATRTTTAAGFRDLRLAQALDSDFEATRRALAAGQVDAEKASVVVQAVRALTDEHDDLPAGIRATAEAHLLELAREHDAPTLRQLGKRLFEVVCPEAADEAEGRKLEEEERRARRLVYLSITDNGDGTSGGRFRLPTLHADLLKKALQELTSPRRLGDGRQDPRTGKKLSQSTLLGQGFMDLLENHLDLDSLPGNGGSPFTLVVNIDLDVLMNGLGAAAVETGHRISAGEARRLACKAGIIPAVLGGDSVPLDLGRERRLFSKHQRVALAKRYGGCAAVNCDRPPAWAEAHHVDPWRRGGRTDLDNGIPLCPPHHRMADSPQSWNMRRLPGGGVRFSRRT